MYTPIILLQYGNNDEPKYGIGLDGPNPELKNYIGVDNYKDAVKLKYALNSLQDNLVCVMTERDSAQAEVAKLQRVIDAQCVTPACQPALWARAWKHLAKYQRDELKEDTLFRNKLEDLLKEK